MLRPDVDANTAIVDVKPATAGNKQVRRVVTGSPVVDGGAADAVSSPTTTMTDIWHTGGPLRSVDQGGDPDGPWSLEQGWHVTSTVDVDVVLRGRVLLELPDGVQTELGAGDVVIQRGTNHRWTAIGDEQFAMASVMIDAFELTTS